MCKWFGPIPSDNDKDINTTSHFLRNRNASASWIEEERYCGSNNKLAENRKQSRLASWRARNWEGMTPTREQWGYKSSMMINTTRVTEPPTLMDEDEVDDSSKDIDTNSTTIWYTPPNKSIEERRGRSESYDSSQSLGYFTAASRLSTMGCEIYKSLDYEYNEEDYATSYKDSTHEIETRIMAALCEQERKIKRSEEVWWMNDDRSCNSADLSSVNTIDTYDDWDEDETKLIPNGYKCKTMYELFQHQAEVNVK